MTTKVSSAQIQNVLDAVPGTLRKLASERDFWKKEATSRMQRDEATKVAHAMHEKGIRSEVDINTLIDQLEKAAEKGELSKIAMAVDLSGPDMGQKLASLTTTEADDAQHSGAGESSFVRFILGGVG